MNGVTRVFPPDVYPRMSGFFNLVNETNPGTYTNIVQFNMTRGVDMMRETPVPTYTVGVQEFNSALSSFTITPIDRYIWPR